MKLITLSARQCHKQVLRLFPSWVSNGHWAIKRTRLSNAGVFISKASAQAYIGANDTVIAHDDDSLIDKILSTRLTTSCYTATRILVETGKKTARLFVDDVTGELAAFDAVYSSVFGVTRLFGENGKCFTDSPSLEDSTVVLMPVVLDSNALIVLTRHMTSKMELPL